MNVPGWKQGSDDVWFPLWKYISLAIWIYLTVPPSWLKLHPGKRTCGFILHYNYYSVSSLKKNWQAKAFKHCKLDKAHMIQNYIKIRASVDKHWYRQTILCFCCSPGFVATRERPIIGTDIQYYFCLITNKINSFKKALMRPPLCL